MAETTEHLKREIGVLGLSANLINTMVGAGIFALPAIVAAGLGSASIFAYLFCGLLIAFVMLCFAEVGSKITTSGGAYTYIQSSFGPYFGFLTVVLFGLSTISADAAVANAVADIIGSIFPFFKSEIIRVIFFLVIFSGLGYINVIGVREGMRLVKILTISKLIPLFLLIFFSWGEFSMANIAFDSIPSINDIGTISLILFFAFQGAESGLSVSGEVDNPQKNIPRAIFFSIAGVLTLYILIQTVAQGVLGDSLASYKENPLSIVANQVFGPIGFTILTVGAAISMFGTLSSELLGMPRVLFRASKDKVLPFKPLSKVHKKYATPYVSVIVYASLGFLFSSLGGFKQLAVFSSATILLVYLGVSLSVIKLRKKNILKEDGFRIPGGYTVPILSSLIIVWLLTNLNQFEVIAIAIFITVLSLLYFLRKKFKKTLK
ncbi:APC family permease [Flavobacterium muglaense]|uniref:Amino acid permease n=1 Tax=Flavobacterium muglaense TaxID=2764716 RepID=A0A923MY31_9FLAO|nr:APC family permease [Flavobacterium muglaense]MBC5837814.1 amino acid permease [Flavobacterium muglaense]MBC5844428.1 amino acid permease [Flavobacterium muglaense]